MKTMRKISVLGSALVITAGMVTGFATNAEAAPPGKGLETRSIVVRYADLDATHEAGARALYQRLRLAATQVCGTYEVRDLAVRAAWFECRDAALADAVERLGNEHVAALYRANQRGSTEAQQRIAVLK